MIRTIILTHGRAAQFDLLTQSLRANDPQRFLWPRVIVADPAGQSFERAIRARLERAHDYVCFMCDDGILYRPIGEPPLPRYNELCFSLRLGQNTIYQYPTGELQPAPMIAVLPWYWPGMRGDFGYPGSVDGHVFRTDTLRRVLAGRSFPNPTALECAMVDGCAELAGELPLMRSFAHSVYVGNPVNRVSEQSNVRFGERFPAPAAGLAERFAAGDRLDLAAMNFSGVDGAHSEVELRWRSESLALR